MTPHAATWIASVRRWAMGDGQSSNRRVVFETAEAQKCVDALHRRRNDGQTVAPIHLREAAVHLVDRAAENRCPRIGRRKLAERHFFAVGDGAGQRLLDLRPQCLARIVEQLGLAMRCESSGIKGHAGRRHAAVNGRQGRLLGESRPGDGDGRNADIFGGDARTRLFWGAQPATAVAADDGIDAQLLQPRLEPLR